MTAQGKEQCERMCHNVTSRCASATATTTAIIFGGAPLRRKNVIFVEVLNERLRSGIAASEALASTHPGTSAAKPTTHILGHWHNLFYFQTFRRLGLSTSVQV